MIGMEIMSKQLEYFKIEIKPFLYAGLRGGVEKVYNITAQVDGIKHQVERVTTIPPYMSELEFLTRMALEIKDVLAEEYFE